MVNVLFLGSGFPAEDSDRYAALTTEICGGARVGNWAIGRVGITAEPARMISRAQTVAKTGRLMKKSTNI